MQGNQTHRPKNQTNFNFINKETDAELNNRNPVKFNDVFDIRRSKEIAE